jgi:chemotaxis protein methyltransferase CheR
MAIVLQEEGLFERCRLYATDMEAEALEKAKAGIFPLGLMQEYTANYLRAGGQGSFSEYYTAKYESAIFRQGLKKHMIFSQHNLTTDGSFNEFNVIMCRNVLIYFNAKLQDRVLNLFNDSLQRRGVLALGHRETLTATELDGRFEELDKREKLYKKRS